ncbi:hypothetical protein SAMN05192534_101347 [Alteribacillus persepolensis]|uniref:YprB ribonuclease H-like domain-containing protein n=1 Tax=Alteribacillus persepolensis TaxID=568899 RepID=A0A1G7Z082_9BACI|nr:ribonuclease H-like domain-containing protein [Alteribacillus persepolensis]SDH02172.1 hypothetical protein SAMN05192534_101347 [Alteribacillus persepolensis]
MSVKNKLHRMKHHMRHPSSGSDDSKQKQQTEEIPASHADIPYEEEWKNIDASACFFDDQFIIKREINYPLDYSHGRYRLGELHDVFQEWGNMDVYHPLHPEKRKPDDLLFFDTETTGLNSGAGNMIFLLGGAQCVGGSHVKVQQFFLPGPDAEVALYHHFLKDTASAKYLVTYNGKAFDWPQLKTRHTFVRNEVPKLPAFGHFDLLHASRRLFKHRLSSCKLTNVEQHMLHMVRKDDTPGYLAPMLYFDFLHEKHPDLIKGVLQHNEWDVLSLITLYINLSKRILNHGTNSRETYEIARWFAQLKEWEKVVFCCKRALEDDTETEEWHSSCLFLLGQTYKKLKQHHNALDCFKHVLSQNRTEEAKAAAVEIAKYYEHQEKDVEQALYYALKANTLADRENPELNKRIKRLQNKQEIQK